MNNNPFFLEQIEETYQINFWWSNCFLRVTREDNKNIDVKKQLIGWFVVLIERRMFFYQSGKVIIK